MFTRHLIFMCSSIAIGLYSCGGDDDSSSGAPCEAADSAPIYQESEGLVLVEFESATFSEGWELVTGNPDGLTGITGAGYMRYEGDNQFNNPGAEGLASFQINITNTGTYRFLWHSAVTEGDDPTESNDSFLRFGDADDYYGLQGTDRFVYPGGTGKTPNPEGSGSVDGWFKIYRSGNPLDFKWQARTSDNDAHNIYVRFDSPGIYLMEVSGRSQGHAIDKFVLYQEDAYSESQATESTLFSGIDCQ